MYRSTPEHHNRRSIRLSGYDYSQAGAYFLTICTWQGELTFGDVVDNEMQLSPAGIIVADEWFKSADVRTEIDLDAFVVMPNHIHGILVINNLSEHDRRRGDRPVAPTATTHDVPNIQPRGPQPRSVGAFVAGFKSAATKRINTMLGTPGMPVWQRNYYEHIIRDESSLYRIREYIAANPERWMDDAEWRPR